MNDPQLWADLLALVLSLDEAHRKNLAPLDIAPSVRPWTPEDARAVREHYETLLQAYPDDLSRACDWGEAAEQARLLDDLLQAGDVSGARVLDLGCGSGGLLARLLDKGQRPARFIGVDASPGLLQRARQVFPQAEWQCGDVFSGWGREAWSMENYDIVFASGLFGVRPRHWPAAAFNRLILDVIQKALAACESMLALNFIPAVYPILRKALDMKNDTGAIAYHRLDRLAFLEACRPLAANVATLSPTLERLLVQSPLFLTRLTSRKKGR